MPIREQVQINEQCKLYLWEITEDVEGLMQLVRLTPQDSAKLAGFGSDSRRKEFLATRALLQRVLGSKAEIEYDEHGRPGIADSDLGISIAHTRKFVGMILGEGHDLALDMEHVTNRIFRVAKRFLSEEELKHVSKNESTVHLYQHWCAKECLIKLYGRKDVDSINELKINPFSPANESFTGQILKHGFQGSYTFRHLRINGHILVYCCQAKITRSK